VLGRILVEFADRYANDRTEAHATSPAPLTLPAMATDDCHHALRMIHARLQAEERWTCWDHEGFTWWPHPPAQHVLGVPAETVTLKVMRINSRMPVIECIRASSLRVSAALEYINGRAGDGSAIYTFDSSTRRIESLLEQDTHSAHGGVAEIAARIAGQVVAAERLAANLATDLAGRIARSRHPASGPRHTPTPLLRASPGPQFI
jgi:hypothetical protein